MSNCYILTKKQFIEQMGKLIGDDDCVVFSTIKQGSMGGATKRKLKHFETGFPGDCFKDKSGIHDLATSFSAGMILLEKEHWSEKVKETMESNKEGVIKNKEGSK